MADQQDAGEERAAGRSGCLSFFEGLFRFAFIAIVLAAVAAGLGIYLLGSIVTTEEVTVPNVVNMPTDQAMALLAANNLSIGQLVELENEDVEYGRVVNQEPEAGSKVKVRRDVKLYKSLGPNKIDVPDVRGKSHSDAALELNRNNLQVSVQTETYHASVPKGQVITTSPAPGAKISKTGSVSLLVSLGSRPAAYLMPNIVNRNLDEVTDGLQSMGVQVDAVHVEHPDSAMAGKVLKQSIPAGSRVQAGDAVQLEVASAPGSEEQSAMRLLTLTLPPEALASPVRVEVDDDLGKRTVFEAPSVKTLSLSQYYYLVGTAEVTVYVGGTLISSEVYTPLENEPR